ERKGGGLLPMPRPVAEGGPSGAGHPGAPGGGGPGRVPSAHRGRGAEGRGHPVAGGEGNCRGQVPAQGGEDASREPARAAGIQYRTLVGRGEGGGRRRSRLMAGKPPVFSTVGSKMRIGQIREVSPVEVDRGHCAPALTIRSSPAGNGADRRSKLARPAS